MIRLESFNEEFCARILICLGHFLWQGLLITAVVTILLRCLHALSSRTRYLVAFGGMLAMAVCPIATYSILTTTDAIPIDASADSAAYNIQLDTEVAVAAIDAPMATAINAANQLERETSAKPTSWQQYAPFAVGVYLLGVTVLLLRLAAGLAGGQRLRRRSRKITDTAFVNVINRLSAEFRFRAFPAVAWCDRVAVPTVIGVIRPLVLIPAASANRMTVDQFENALRHEFAHLRRFDHLANLVQRIIEALLFFHPIVWWLSNRVRLEREQCCDDAVLASGCSAADYAKLLLKLAEYAGKPQELSVALHATGKRSQLGLRIQRILGQPAESRSRFSAAGVAITALVLLIAPVSIALPGSRDAGETGDPTSTTTVADAVSESPPNNPGDSPTTDESEDTADEPDRTERTGTDITIHIDGTFSIGESDETLSLDEVTDVLRERFAENDRQLTTLWVISSSDLREMENSRYLNSFYRFLITMYEAGGRRLRSIDPHGHMHTQALSPKAVAAARKQLARNFRDTLKPDILQRRDPQRRQNALAVVLELVESDSTDDQLAGLQTLVDVRAVRFEPELFRRPVRTLLMSEDDHVRARAVTALGIVGDPRVDLGTLLARRDDPGAAVRTQVLWALNHLDPTCEYPGVIDAAVGLINDDDKAVVRGTLRSIRSMMLPTSVAGRLIELSRDDELLDDVVQYGFQAVKTMTAAMAKRLIEIIHEHSGTPLEERALFVLASRATENAARPEVIRALTEIFDDSNDGQTRNNCIFGIGLHRGAEAREFLESIINSESESEPARSAARAALDKYAS